MDFPEQTTSELLDLTEGTLGEKVAFRLKVDKAEVDKAVRKVKNFSLGALIGGLTVMAANIYGVFKFKSNWAKGFGVLGALLSAGVAAIGGAGLKAISSGELRKKVDAIETGEVIVMDKAEFDRSMKDVRPEDRAKIEMVDLKDVPELQQNQPAARSINFAQMIAEQSAQVSQLIR